MNEIIDIIHKTIFQFFDVCGDDEEVPMSDKDKLLLKVNKAICNNLKALEQEPILDKIRAEIMQLDYDIEDIDYDYNDMAMTEEVHMICREEVLQIIDKYKSEVR